MAEEYVYEGKCPNCGDEFRLTYGEGYPMNRSLIIVCEGCKQRVDAERIIKMIINGRKIKLETISLEVRSIVP